ncbi:Ribosomal protein S18 acetylase RimI [Pseudooceanicola antarcticus]|uniref:GNAT family N-acetyltransferase n=1 Tax=Pseudooceanicola antarcticus TaxID=1247613 RepID=A0A285IG60_9RHOB|nr:GNAT family N-acetyltransferase [Pseudooceanicola antarcticus]PJE29240.1 GNAT family N-acetyltransferase [Pseudooceanicola antarcticus]SNY46913.1 Ribosomal protein S18 acetylase RimI [Pseudooceanicola antarcticus]
MTPIRLGPEQDILPTHALLTRAFAYMEGRIDPPSSLGRLPPEALAREAAAQELWVLPPVAAPLACMLLTPKADHLYLGKLAVADAARGRGMARRMVVHAEARARALGLPCLRLQTRVELTENHATFQRLGFVEIARTAHAGYDRPTSLTFEKAVTGA